MKEKIVINCTPHDITIVGKDGSIVATIMKSGIIPRLHEVIHEVGNINIDGVEVPIKNKEFGGCENLPEKRESTFLIVSGLIAQAVRRDDLLVPNTVRDGKGQIIGCDSFAQIR